MSLDLLHETEELSPELAERVDPEAEAETTAAEPISRFGLLSAGAYLLEVAPERALPVLRAICVSETGLNAGMTAYLVLNMYDTEQQKQKKP